MHASDLFTSAPAAEDLAAVITALGLGKVDLYGDSYGSFFAQVFASRFPQLVHSVILDSTYETVGLDPWYRSTIESMPSDFDVACSRAPTCASAAPGPSWTSIEALAASLRAHPITGVVPGPQGAPQKVSMGVTGLVNLLSDAAEDTNIYRELDASARALLDADDAAPLLRLYAQRLAVDEAYFGEPVREYSVELYLATSCLDYPQLFDMNATPAQRAERRSAACGGGRDHGGRRDRTLRGARSQDRPRASRWLGDGQQGWHAAELAPRPARAWSSGQRHRHPGS